MGVNISDTGGFNQQFFQTYFKKSGELKDGSHASLRLKDGILSRQDHDSIKESYLEEAQKAGLDTATAEAEFESFLSDALDGELDNKSATGMLEAVQLLGSHSQEVNALKFRDVPFKAPTGRTISEIIPRVGLLTPRSAEPIATGQDHEHTFQPTLDMGSVKATLASLGQDNPLSSTQQRRILQAFADMPILDRSLFEKKIDMLTPEQRKDMLDRVEGVKNPDLAAAKAIVNSILLLPPNGSVSGLVNMKPMGSPKLELNNPEQIASEGFVFRSESIEQPLALGTETLDMDIYGYANLVKDGHLPGQKGNSFQNKDAVYEMVTITNPIGNPDMKIEIDGSGYANSSEDVTSELADLPQYKGNGSHDAIYMVRPPDGRTPHYGHLADKLLSHKVLTHNPTQRTHDHHTQRTLKPGESITIYTRIDNKRNSSGSESNMRFAYHLHVDKPTASGHKPLQIDASVVGYPTGKAGLDTKLKASLGAPSGTLDLNISEIAAHLNGGKEVKESRYVATGFIPPAKGNAATKLKQTFLPGNAFDPADVSVIKEKMNELKLQAAHLAKKIKQYPMGVEPDTKGVLPTKAQLQQNLDAVYRELKAYSIGRNSGLTPYSGLASVFPTMAVDGETPFEFDVAVNTKPFDTLGTGQDQSTPINRTLYGKEQVLSNAMPLAYGNYNNTYQLQFPVSNVSADKPQSIYISMGSPEEIDQEPSANQERFGKLYDVAGKPQPSVFTEDTSLRYNGTARITVLDENGKPAEDIKPNPQTVDVTHRNYQVPKPLAEISVPPHRRYTVQVEFTVPTNSTGPQALRVSTHP